MNLRRPAINSCHSNFQSIFIMNLFFGWTIAGWVVVLFRAISPPPEGEGGTFKVTPVRSGTTKQDGRPAACKLVCALGVFSRIFHAREPHPFSRVISLTSHVD